MTKTRWVLAGANDFVQQISTELSAIGVHAEIIGSVARNGVSDNDLDLLLRPKKAMSLEGILEAIHDRLRPILSDDKGLNPLEAAGHQDTWFVNLALRDGRVVEFYLQESDFPMGPW